MIERFKTIWTMKETKHTEYEHFMKRQTTGSKTVEFENKICGKILNNLRINEKSNGPITLGDLGVLCMLSSR